jgi:NADH-quinone oxidoreductase subunit N
MKWSSADVLVLLPLVIAAATSIVAMLGIAIRRSHLLVAWLTLVGLAAALVSIWFVAPLTPRQVTPLVIVDRFALFYIGLNLAACFTIAVLAYSYLEKQQEQREELYVLLLTATLGSGVLVVSNHFATFFLGLEILSVSLYALSAYLRRRPLPLEAGAKYLVLAASSAAFLLFGMALLYAEFGTMSFIRIGPAGTGATGSHAVIVLTGLVFLITGFGFKLGVVPFHLWAPDVYEGAPAPVTAFIATVSKGSMFAVLLKYFYGSEARHLGGIYLVFSIIAIASMFGGNLLALLQNNVKRILAYSSIAHMGYLLVAFQAGGSFGLEAVTFYLVAYFITTLGAFGVITVLSDGERDADSLEDYRGLFWRRPGLALIFTAMLLSLAGIPLTAGFFAKFYIVASGASVGIWALILCLVISSVIGLFYYLRIVVTMFADMPAGAEKSLVVASQLSFASVCALLVLTIALIWLGVSPSALLTAIHAAIEGVG